MGRTSEPRPPGGRFPAADPGGTSHHHRQPVGQLLPPNLRGENCTQCFADTTLAEAINAQLDAGAAVATPLFTASALLPPVGNALPAGPNKRLGVALIIAPPHRHQQHRGHHGCMGPFQHGFAGAGPHQDVSGALPGSPLQKKSTLPGGTHPMRRGRDDVLFRSSVLADLGTVDLTADFCRPDHRCR